MEKERIKLAEEILDILFKSGQEFNISPNTIIKKHPHLENRQVMKTLVELSDLDLFEYNALGGLFTAKADFRKLKNQGALDLVKWINDKKRSEKLPKKQLCISRLILIVGIIGILTTILVNCEKIKDYF